MTTTRERLLTLLRNTFVLGLNFESSAIVLGLNFESIGEDAPAYTAAAVAAMGTELEQQTHNFLASVGLAPEPESTIDAALDQLPPAEREAFERRYPGIDQERTDAVTYTDSSGTTLLVTRPTPPPPPPPPLASEDATPRKKRTATKRKAK